MRCQKVMKGGTPVILTIDIGNSNIALGGFVDGELSFVVRISTEIRKTADEYASKINLYNNGQIADKFNF